MATDKQYDDTTDPRVGTTFTRDGWTIRVDTMADEAGSPDDADCFTDAQKAAWRADEWSFVVLRVRASREGIELGTGYLGGIESGWFTYTEEDDTVTGHGYVGPYTEAVDDTISDAITEAEATLAKLRAT